MKWVAARPEFELYVEKKKVIPLASCFQGNFFFPQKYIAYWMVIL